jgi:hypothetical protein
MEDAVEFAEWIEKNNYQAVHSKIVKPVIKWVDAKIHTVYINGSDYHFEKLYKNHAVTTEELYQIFTKLKLT